MEWAKPCQPPLDFRSGNVDFLRVVCHILPPVARVCERAGKVSGLS